MSKEISLENVIRRCGDFGRYQLLHYTFLNLICMAGGMNAYYYVFGVAEPSFRCRLPRDVWQHEDRYASINETHQLLIDAWTSSTSKCDRMNGTKCTEFVYDRSIFGRTLTEEANFVCSHAVKRTWLTTVFQIGVSSTLVTGPIGDKIGRRKIIQILTTMMFAISVGIQLLLQFIGMSMNVKFALLLINQLMSGVSAFSMVFLLLTELTSSSHTSLAGNLALFAYTLGEGMITVFAYIARDWLMLKWLSSAYYCLILFYLYFVPESPYWLLGQRKFSELEVCLRKIASVNRRQSTEWFPLYEQLVEDAVVQTKTVTQTKTRKIGYISIRLCICGLIGFVTMLSYIKISYGLGAMNANLTPHWSIAIGAVVEAMGYVSASLLITTRLGRKYALMAFALMTSICVLAIPLINEAFPTMTIIISQIGKLSVSGAVSVSWVYVPELFPTSTRGFGNAVFVSVGRIGAIIAPVVDAALEGEQRKITFYVYSALTLAMIGIVAFLPETRNRSFNDGQADDNSHE